VLLRRIVLSLVLILFAAVPIGVILGLDASARSQLAGRVLRSPSPTPEEPTPQSSPPRTATPTPTPTTTPTPTPTPTTRPTMTRTPRPTPTPPPSVVPKATAKPKAKPAPKPTSGSGATKKKAPAKVSDQRYLKGRLTKGSGGTVYLTFDDGPSPFTGRILDVLTRTGSTATFFHLGVNEPGFPRTDAQIRAQGSKIANHSYDHPDLTTLTGSQLRWQLSHGPKARCFRPPYGATNAAVRKAIADAGMRQVLWDVDTLDWMKPGVTTLAKTGRLKGIRNGSIILMHDGGGERTQTVAALPTILADLHARGFKVRALPHC
jgi:peptidoglycan/xylan/chitin deacetylase (PgdA/CDA1 family)